MSENLITLVLPTGDTHSYPICSHGRGFEAYQEDPHDSGNNRWLVDVTPEAGREFMQKGGFYLYEPQMRRRLSGDKVPLVHVNGPISVSFDGDTHRSEETVMPNGTVVHVLAVPAEAVLTFVHSHPGFAVLCVADYQAQPETDAGQDDEKADQGEASAPRTKRGKREAD